MATVIPNKVRPAMRFSNQTKISPMKAVRKGRNMYIQEFYLRKSKLLLISIIEGLLSGI